MIDVEPFIKEVLEKKIPEENIGIFNRFYHTSYSEVDKFINQLYDHYRARLIAREEIANIISEDYCSNDIRDYYPYEKYLSLLWKEEYLNEKDIDLLDLCLFYQYIDNEVDILGYWVTGHGGDTYEKFEAKGTLEALKPKIQAFVERCYERYEEVMQIYLEAPEKFKTK